MDGKAPAFQRQEDHRIIAWYFRCTVAWLREDGTRLFWNVGVYLTVFDLTTRQVTNQFNSGLPTTVGRTFSLSQDGRRAYFSDRQGDVAILDTYYGTVLASYNAGAATDLFRMARINCRV